MSAVTVHRQMRCAISLGATQGDPGPWPGRSDEERCEQAAVPVRALRALPCREKAGIETPRAAELMDSGEGAGAALYEHPL